MRGRMLWPKVDREIARSRGSGSLRHAIEIVGLALEPVGAGKDVDDGRNRCALGDLEPHPDAAVLARREQVIDDVEAPLAVRPVDRGRIDEAEKLTALVVAQEGYDF